jgi:Mg-chelatase subunit ChlD
MSRAIKLLCGAAVVLAAAAFTGTAGAQEKKDKPAAQQRPEVEVVFCLDTTGSMGGLIDAAKRKIWSICSQIASGKPTPQLRVGLVAYRDRGDAYVTKVFDLTDDLDAVHANLMAFQAQGGGDFPESVNQALHESVTKINWGRGKKALKIIFLVGDAPPHMDYKDDVKYPETCKLAVRQDIIINTIQCGTHAQTKKYWQEICRLAEGSFVQIDQGGGPVVTIATPFDKDLAQINVDLNRTTLVYGSRSLQQAGEAKKAINAGLAPGVAADRAAYFGYGAGGHGMMGGGGFAAGPSYDLLVNIKAKKVKLEELKKEELPPELQKLTLKEQKAYLEKLDKERQQLTQKAGELAKKRAAFIAQKQAEQTKNAGRDSFDNQVLQVLQRQAARVQIRYETPAPEEKKKK